MFISADYAARDWTRLERRAALSRAVHERQEYVLPARFDDTRLPGLLSDMETIDLRHRSPQQFAAMVTSKLVALGICSSSSTVRATDPGSDVDLVRSPGAVSEDDADPWRGSVHAAISKPKAPGAVPSQSERWNADTANFSDRARPRPGASVTHEPSGQVTEPGHGPPPPAADLAGLGNEQIRMLREGITALRHLTSCLAELGQTLACRRILSRYPHRRYPRRTWPQISSICWHSKSVAGLGHIRSGPCASVTQKDISVKVPRPDAHHIAIDLGVPRLTCCES